METAGRFCSSMPIFSATCSRLHRRQIRLGGCSSWKPPTFGAPPDVDDDPKIYILILQLDRGLLGFFDPGNATNPNPELRRDMIFINSAVLLTNQYAAGGTLAHEFQHLIHSGHDGDEETWLDEGLSGYAELLSGHPEIDSTNVPEFLRRPGIGVTGWQDQSYNYGATYLYVAFLAERFGVGVMGDLVSEPRNGIDGVDATLAPFQENFRTTWAEWTAANYAATDVRFGYDAIGERRAAPLVVPPPRLPFERKGAAVDEQWGTTYVLFREAGSTEIEFFGDPNGRYAVQIYVMRNGSGDLRNMELDRDSHGFTRVANADSFVVIVGRTSVRGEEFELSARNFDPVTAVVAAAAADEAGLELPFPNPFNSHVVLPFHLQTEGADAVLRLYGVLGNPIRTLRLGILPRGTHQLTWDGTDDQGRQVASGRYPREAAGRLDLELAIADAGAVIDGSHGSGSRTHCEGCYRTKPNHVLRTSSAGLFCGEKWSSVLPPALP